ncbi:MAG: hypothetical protein ACE364_08855 [Chlorobiota bacterium]
MKQSFTKLAFMLLLALTMALPSTLFSGVDEAEMTEKLPALLGQDNMGREFWFAIPPVYEEVAGDNFVRVLVTSDVETDVVIQVEGKGVYKKKTTIPNSVIDFELNPAQAQPIPHRLGTHISPPAKIYKGAGVQVSADQPIVVYVVIKYKYTSDGFLALPVSGLGDRYINMVYQDPALGGANSHAPAFTCVTGVYDNTQVNMTMGGGPMGSDKMKLDGGRELATGDQTSFFLDRGDVWMGASSGHFQDISGSLFEGTKPFAIVSGMHCANFPVGNAWCDYTVEMELPTYAWGKQYYITPMEGRTYNGIIRIYAAEDNTTIYRNGQVMGLLTHGGGNTIGKAYMEMRVWPKLDDFGQAIRPKIATIHADKPIAVMYYNTGTQEDVGTADSDPFQLFFTPIEQFQTEILFPSPNALGGTDFYTKNYVNIVYEMHEDFIPQDLMFAKMEVGRDPDWKPVSQVVAGAPRVFTEKYQGKEFGTSTLSLPTEGVFSLRSDSTKFVAYSYGFASYESYGFPTSAALRDLSSPDTNAPVPNYVQECNGDVLKDMGTVTDMPEDDEVRSNMADLYLIENLNDNYVLDYRIPGTNNKDFIPGEQRTLSWWLTVVDKTQPARATIAFLDRAGNDTTITISYDPPEFEVVSGNAFGVMAASDAPVVMQDTIRNLSTTVPQYITKVELQDGGQGFSIASFEPAGWTPPMEIGPGEEVIVNIEFDPAAAAASGEKAIYIDSLGVGYGDEDFNECGFAYFTEQSGSLGVPVIEVTDWDFGTRNINEVTPDTRIMTITNTGDEMLRITGISQDLPAGSMFTHNFMTLFPDVSVDTPLEIAPGDLVEFQVGFMPTAVGTYAENIVFDNNTKDGNTTDHICELKGVGTDAPVSADGYVWQGVLINRPATFPAGPYDVDVDSQHDGFIVKNLGDADGDIAQVVSINIVSETPNAREYFRTKNGDENIVDFLNNSIRGLNLAGDVTREEAIVFNPTEKGLHRIEFELVFNEETGNATLPVVYEGIGEAPNVEVTNVTFAPMLVNDEANAQTTGVMTITNTDDEYGHPLNITGISFDNAIVSDDIADFQGLTFRYDGNLYQDLVDGNIILNKGQSLNIPVHFVARQVGNNSVVATIESNAYVDGPDYDNDSDWNGVGTDLIVNISSPYTLLCLNETEFINITLSNPGTDNPVTINELSLSDYDLDGDGVDDLFITSPTTNVTVPVNGDVNVVVEYTPTGLINRQFVELIIDHDYGNNLAINGADEALEVESEFFVGNTQTNVTGASSSNPTNPDYDTEYMVSIGDEFEYQIGLTGNASGTDAQTITVNINYNSLFTSPLIEEGNNMPNITSEASAEVQPGSYSVAPDANGPKGSMVMTFTLQSTDGSSIFANNNIIASVPFRVVLPAVNEEGALGEIGQDDDSYGRFDMSHTLTDLPTCYAHTEDDVLLAIEEICVGDYRALYVSDFNFGEPNVTPNPASSAATIEYTVPYDMPGEIILYNSAMQQVKTLYSGEMKEGVRTADVPVSELSNGTYFFTVKIGEKQQMGRIVIEK